MFWLPSYTIDMSHPFWVQLGLYEVAPGGGVSVRYVQLLEEDAAPTAMELEDALPLTALLAPVGKAKDAIVAALDSLQAEPFDPAETGEHHNEEQLQCMKQYMF